MRKEFEESPPPHAGVTTDRGSAGQLAWTDSRKDVRWCAGPHDTMGKGHQVQSLSWPETTAGICSMWSGLGSRHSLLLWEGCFPQD
jgi:hypothetical protein